MAKKAFLKDHDNIEILPITRGELVLDSSGNPAFSSNEFLATTSQPGLMSKEDKQKLGTIAGNTIDTELSNTSTNPVQNKVLTQIINSIRDKYLKSAVVSGNKITITDQSNNTVEFVNSTYQIVTNAVDGLVPKYDAVDGTIDTQTTDWVLTNHNGTLGWYKLPNTAFSSSSVQLFIGAKSTSNNNNSNSATTNGNTYLKLFDNSTLKNQYNIKGTGLTTVVSDDSGTITINVPISHNQASSDINSLTGYSKATGIAAIATTDSLNTALGKLELKADTTYELVKGAYDGDGTIENLAEILKVLEGISDTDTIQAIVGKYLPLTGGTIEGGFGALTVKINNQYGTGITFSNTEKTLGTIGFEGNGNPSWWNAAGTSVYTLIHSGNYADTTDKRYLKLSGGTITGGVGVYTPLVVKTANISEIWIQFQDTVGTCHIGSSNGIPSINTGSGNHTIIHSGNISSQSVASATKLVNANGYTYATTYNVDKITVFGDETAQNGYKTYLDGTSITLRYGTSNTVGLTLNSSGNVLIGTADNVSGFKLQTGNAYLSGVVSIGTTLDLNRNGNSGALINSTKMGLQIEPYAERVQFKTFLPSGSNYTSHLTLTSKGNVLIGTTTDKGYKLDVNGQVAAIGFVKSGSSDSYVLLGGGGHKAISDFLLKSELANQELSNNLTTITKTLTVTKDWMDTGIKHTDLTTGTYIVQVTMNSVSNLVYNGIWSGVMSWTSTSDGTNGTDSDEILLHRASHACNDRTIYLRTLNSVGSAGTHLRLQIAANKNFSSATYTFKFKKLI